MIGRCTFGKAVARGFCETGPRVTAALAKEGFGVPTEIAAGVRARFKRVLAAL